MALLINQEEFDSSIKNKKRIEDFLIKNVTIKGWVPEFPTNIVDTRFEGCKFVGGENSFLRTVFKNVSFLDCELDGVVFTGSFLTLVRFTNSHLFNKCDFKTASLTNVDFYNCDVINCDFSGVMLLGCSFQYGNFKMNNIDGLKHRENGNLLKDVDFSGNVGTMQKI